MMRLRSALFVGLLIGPTSVGTAMIYQPPFADIDPKIERRLPRGAQIEGIEGQDLLPTPHDQLREGELEVVLRR